LRFERQLIWLEAAMANRLGAMRGPGEDYSDVIMRIAGAGGRMRPIAWLGLMRAAPLRTSR
jgi:hypothetical protein